MEHQFLCSISEAAKLLSIGRTKIYEMLARDEISSVQIGTRRLIKVESLRALIDRASGGVA